MATIRKSHTILRLFLRPSINQSGRPPYFAIVMFCHCVHTVQGRLPTRSQPGFARTIFNTLLTPSLVSSRSLFVNLTTCIPNLLAFLPISESSSQQYSMTTCPFMCSRASALSKLPKAEFRNFLCSPLTASGSSASQKLGKATKLAPSTKSAGARSATSTRRCSCPPRQSSEARASAAS